MLDKNTIDTIKNIIFKYIDAKDNNVFIFGSRATNKAKEFSDIDIGIEGNNTIDSWRMAEIDGAFEESDLPYNVDVVDFALTSEKFKSISKQKVILLN